MITMYNHALKCSLWWVIKPYLLDTQLDYDYAIVEPNKVH